MSLPEKPELTQTYLSLLCSSSFKPSVLVDSLASLETTAQVDSSLFQLLPTYYSTYLLSLFLDGDVYEARFLSQRIPNSLKDEPVITNAIALLRALYSRSYASIYACLTNTIWPPEVVPLRDRFLEHFRSTTFDLLSSAYTSISMDTAAHYLGYDPAPDSPLMQQLVSSGWKRDAQTGLLHPVKPESFKKLQAGGAKDDRLGRLTGLVTHLTEE